MILATQLLAIASHPSPSPAVPARAHLSLRMIELIEMIRAEGFDLKILNIGGGLGIDYGDSTGTVIPTPADVVGSVRELVLHNGLQLIVEPGRSIVGPTTVLVTSVIGTKHTPSKSFIVTDGSMSELIRPAMYGAFHRIELAVPSDGREATFDVVGPVCESADFLGKDRVLKTPSEGSRLVVFDCGAYASAMALGSYNLRLPCAEFWVVEGRVYCTRERLSLEQYLAVFPLQPRLLGAISGE